MLAPYLCGVRIEPDRVPAWDAFPFDLPVRRSRGRSAPSRTAMRGTNFFRSEHVAHFAALLDARRVGSLVHDDG